MDKHLNQIFVKVNQRLIPLILSLVLLLTAAAPYGSGKANAAQTGSRIVKIAAGAYHSLALKANGTVVAWGDNSQGQTEVPDELTVPGTVVDIAAGTYHSLALKSDGTVVAWGFNSKGQADVPDELTVPGTVVGIAAGYQHSLALKSDGTVEAWG